MIDWNRYAPFFKAAEMQCKHCGKTEMNVEFLDRLLLVRKEWGKSMIITSGYRCAEHPIEAAKQTPGAHASGHAVDIGTSGADAHSLIRIAMEQGMTGIGVSQKGAGRFIHVDDLQGSTRPGVWSY